MTKAEDAWPFKTPWESQNVAYTVLYWQTQSQATQIKGEKV